MSFVGCQLFAVHFTAPISPVAEVLLCDIRPVAEIACFLTILDMSCLHDLLYHLVCFQISLLFIPLVFFFLLAVLAYISGKYQQPINITPRANYILLILSSPSNKLVSGSMCYLPCLAFCVISFTPCSFCHQKGFREEQQVKDLNSVSQGVLSHRAGSSELSILVCPTPCLTTVPHGF